MEDLISRQAAIDAILAVTGNSSVRELYEHVQEHGLSDMWSGGVNAAIDIIIAVPSAQPDMSEYSDKLWQAAYERGKAEAQAQLEEAYISGETEAEARFHAQQSWIPCSERLPEERQEILATTTDNAWGDVVIIRTYYKEMHKSVIAWMPLPKPYRAERRTDD